MTLNPRNSLTHLVCCVQWRVFASEKVLGIAESVDAESVDAESVDAESVDAGAGLSQLGILPSHLRVLRFT